jgi:hypothetical protein
MARPAISPIPNLDPNTSISLSRLLSRLEVSLLDPTSSSENTHFDRIRIAAVSFGNLASLPKLLWDPSQLTSKPEPRVRKNPSYQARAGSVRYQGSRWATRAHPQG